MSVSPVLQYAKQLMDDNPAITPAEMIHNLHCTGYSTQDCIDTVISFFQLELRELCSLAISEFKHPLVKKDLLTSILISNGFSKSDVTEAINAEYPKDTNRYAVSIGSGKVYASSISAYNLGTGDFTVEAWIKPDKGGGTIISRKPTEGCSGNGGFLLVLKPDGVLKLATDDGYGFYEINSVPVSAYDGKFHHVLGLRRDSSLELYFDFCKINSTVRTDRFSNLNINNSIRLGISFTDQIQEPYNHYSGKIAEIRMWSIAKVYSNKNEWANTDYVTPHIAGMWAFNAKKGDDYSNNANFLSLENVSFEQWQLP